MFDAERVNRFSDIIFEAGHSAPIRRPRGRDIMALRAAEVRGREEEPGGARQAGGGKAGGARLSPRGKRNFNFPDALQERYQGVAAGDRVHMASTVPKPKREEGEADIGQAVETVLGPRSQWPQSLRFALDLCERASVATAIYWGEDFRLFYNQAWAPVLGDRHPQPPGRPAAEVWGALWPEIRFPFEQAFASGQGATVTGQLLPVTRRGIEREAYWTYSLTPDRGGGRVVGLINQGSETTKAHLAERRMAFQVHVADRLRGLDDPEEVKRAATQLLGEYLGRRPASAMRRSTRRRG
jgi:PAS domain-containing protein